MVRLFSEGRSHGDFRKPRFPGGGEGREGEIRGGGVLDIETRSLYLEGKISANSIAGYANAGGSIHLRTGSISGQGIMEASIAAMRSRRANSGVL